MNKTLVAISAAAALVGIILISGAVLFFTGIHYSNAEHSLRNLITAKQTDNKNEMDAMWKIIDQNAQVTVMQKNALMDIFNGYATARTPQNDSGSLALWVKEAVPNIDQSTYKTLMNTISAQRDGFKNRQKELLDLNREHDNLIDNAPSSWFVGGRGKIVVTIVTSTRTENAFQTGKDDDTSLPGVARPSNQVEKQR